MRSAARAGACLALLASCATHECDGALIDAAYVSVRDEAGEAVPMVSLGATIDAASAAVICTERTASANLCVRWAVGPERVGDLLVSVTAPGYAPETVMRTVTAGACGPNSEFVTVTLRRVI